MGLTIDGGLLLVGCGKMGGALLAGWLEQGAAAAQVAVVEPALDPSRTSIPSGVQVVSTSAELPASFAPAVIVFAVKPQVMADVVPSYKAYAAAGSVSLSIAAGTPIDFFTGVLGETAGVVRVMPNTPASIGRGMSVLCANKYVSTQARKMCGELMAAVGDTAWVEDEALMDAVTAVSGSGPAYVFWLIECLAEAGQNVGLPAALSRQLALETVAGAGELARQSEETPSQLRLNVSSPGGTTLAALEVLMADDGLAPLMTAAVKAAARRGRELAG